MRAAACILLACAALQVGVGAGAVTCTASSTAAPPRVVELYTSEGCSSCPPADQWLSTFKGRADVIALGFHVNYWDRLGWPDRFASEANTRRQQVAAARLGSPSVYTPQVLVDGRDWRGWPRLPEPEKDSRSLPQLTLSRAADGRVQVRVQPDPAARQHRGGYWAVTEHGHESRVRAGENAGETLRHDHVVRLLRAVPPFDAREGLASTLDVPPGVAAFPRRTVFVVTDWPTERPLQAVAIDC